MRCCCSAGILSALGLLAGSTMQEGGTIILVSDGQETSSPRIRDVQPQVRAHPGRVHGGPDLCRTCGACPR